MGQEPDHSFTGFVINYSLHLKGHNGFGPPDSILNNLKKKGGCLYPTELVWDIKACPEGLCENWYRSYSYTFPDSACLFIYFDISPKGAALAFPNNLFWHFQHTSAKPFRRHCLLWHILIHLPFNRDAYITHGWNQDVCYNPEWCSNWIKRALRHTHLWIINAWYPESVQCCRTAGGRTDAANWQQTLRETF